MAHINQGIFNQFKNKYEELNTHFKNFETEKEQLDILEWYDILFSGGVIYAECNELLKLLPLETIRFEMFDKRKEYEEIILNIETIQQEVTSECNRIISDVKYSYSFLSNAEINTILKIRNEYGIPINY